jgi:hypothetical protein
MVVQFGKDGRRGESKRENKNTFQSPLLQSVFGVNKCCM